MTDNKRAECVLFKLKTCFYEREEKSSKLLARQLKQKDTSLLISASNDDKWDISRDTPAINKVFTNFYKVGFKSRVPVDESKFRDVF